MLQHEPRNVSPQGKQNVFFTCHPEDFDRFFQKIFEDIRKFSNCVVWYNTEENNEDINTELEKMNLFVVPITTKLLTKPCRAMKIDIPYAKHTPKPILPLMQERGLDELFTHYFGDLQYLDPNARDETAISYDDKLKKYLNSVLVGDELAEKVRAAFDAYIFLSYRKKDRKYANELMRLIHKNDFCRDIAIWYDEYLVPGEEFNKAISKALEKSDLFTMVVTPNLINEKNYVKTHEYPAAYDNKKNILPVEMEQTDSTELMKQYPKIPNKVNGHDSIALSQALKDSLVQIAHTENDSDPQHNFFIGLAYLNGIDVEINNERALYLITSAAEAKENKVPEAIEKLVTMYCVGQGVERNYRIATEWQKKLVEYWEKKYQISNVLNNYYCLFNELCTLGNMYMILKDIDAAEFSYTRMLTLCNELTKNLPPLPKVDKTISRFDRVMESLKNSVFERTSTILSGHFHKDLPICYDKLGDIYLERGNQDKAFEYYRKSIDLKDQLLCCNGYFETQNDLAISCDKLGELFEAHGNLEEAEKYYRKSFDWRKWKADRRLILPDDINGWLELLYSYEKLGDVYYKRGNLDEAENYYCDAFEICMNIAAQDGCLNIYNNIANNYERIGNIYHEKGNLTETEQCYCDALSIRKDFMNQYESLGDRQNLANTYDMLGDLYNNDLNEFDKAEKFYNNALSIRDELFKEYGFYDLNFSYEKIGSLYNQRNELNKAEDFYQKTLLLREKLIEESDSAQNRYNLSIIYYNLGILYGRRINYYLNKIINGEYKLGDFYKVWHTRNKAKKFYQKAYILIKELSEKTGLLKYKEILAEIYNEFGNIYTFSFFRKKAKKYYQKAYILRKSLVKVKGTIGAQINLLDSYTKLGFIFTKIKELDRAKKYKQMAINLIEHLVNDTGIPNVKFATSYALSYYLIAISNEPYDRELLMKALDIYKILAAQCPHYYSTQRDMIKNILEQME